MADRDELERRVADAMHADQCPDEECNGSGMGEYDRVAAVVLDALGLTEETVWTDDGGWTEWDNVRVDPDTGEMTLHGQTRPATDEDLRAVGLVKKRRWITEWEVITDD